MDKKKLPSKEIITDLLELFNKREFLKLEKKINNFLVIYPDSDDLYNILGVVYKMSNRDVESGDCFSTAYKLNPLNINVINNLFIYYYGKNQFEEAIILLEDSLLKHKKSCQLYTNLGLTYIGLEKFEKAIAKFKYALSIDNNFFSAHFNLAVAYKKNKQLQDSIVSYTKALELNSKSIAAFNGRGNAYFMLEDYDAANADYYKAKSLDINSPEAFFNLASLFLKKDNIEEAEKNLIECLRLNPGYLKANLNLGIIYRLKGENKSAIEYCKKETLINPKDHDALFNIAEIYQLSGKNELSKKFFYLALDNCPDDDKCNFKLAELEEIDGNFIKASELYKKSQMKNWEEKYLNCLYSNLKISNSKKDKDNFYKKLKLYSESINSSRIIASICCHDESNFHNNYSYNFCNSPFDFIYKKNINNKLNNIKITNLIEIIDEIKMDEVNQTLLYNGNQSSGDLFLSKNPFIIELKKIILNEINTYYELYKDNSCDFINNWPKKANIKGWYIKMLSDGFLTRHIHPDGWLSGSLYLKISDNLEGGEGNIEFSLRGENYPLNDKLDHPYKSYSISVADIILFPSSLFHRTIPFKSNESRICIAFDLAP